MQVRCRAQVCLPATGQIQVETHYSDGTTTMFGTGWEQAVPGNQAPPPILPIQPTCVGVPLERCREIGLGAVPAVAGPAIVSIVVTCLKPPRTSAAGDGDTVVTYADRTTSESSWSYRD